MTPAGQSSKGKAKTFKDVLEGIVNDKCGSTLLLEITMVPTDSKCYKQDYLNNKKFTAYNQNKELMPFMTDVSFTGR